MRKLGIAAFAILAVATVVFFVSRPKSTSLVRERTVTLRYDAIEGEVVTEFDTTMVADTYVSVAGVATLPDGRGSKSWIDHPISIDPSGSAGRSTRDDPSGTTYSLVVRFYDAQQNVLATVSPKPVSKP